MYNPFTFTLPELKEINGVVTDWNKIAAKELEKDPHAAAVNVEDLFSQKAAADGFQRMMIFIRTQKGMHSSPIDCTASLKTRVTSRIG